VNLLVNSRNATARRKRKLRVVASGRGQLDDGGMPAVRLFRHDGQGVGTSTRRVDRVARPEDDGIMGGRGPGCSS